LQTLQGHPPAFGQIRPPIGFHSVSKEPWLPLLIIVFPHGSFLPLPFFKLGFQFCSFVELFALDRLGDAGPKALGFIGKLFIERGDNFRDREEGL